MTDYNPKDTYGSYPSSNPTNITIPMMSHDNESQHHHSVLLTPGSRSVNSKRDINKSGNAANNSNDPGQTVERKRRDNINERIQELGAIIPLQFFDLSKEKSSGTKDGKPNKGQILSKSIEYVEFLQDKIDENNKKEIELLIILKKLEEIKQLPDNLRPSKSLFKHTSAEIELSNIGVGPLAENSNKTNNTTSNNNNNNSGNGNTNNNSMTPNQRASPTVNSPSVNFDRTKRASIASIGSPLANATNNDNINSNVPSPMLTKFEQNITPVSNSDSNINNNNNNNNTNFGNSNISSNYNKLSATIMDNDQNFSMGFDQSTVGNNNNGNGNGDESNNSFNASVNNNNGNFGQNTYNNTNNNTNNNNNNNNHSINPTNFMIKPEDYENFGFNFDV